MYQQLLAHTTACYQPPLPAYPHAEVILEEPLAAAVAMGYARDVTAMVAATIPPEFLTPDILITRLERPSSTGWLRRDVWEETQKQKLAQLEAERLGEWPTVEVAPPPEAPSLSPHLDSDRQAKWAAQDAYNNALALTIKQKAAEKRAERQAEFAAIMTKTNRLVDDAAHQKVPSDAAHAC
jgi:hypothetical protein